MRWYNFSTDDKNINVQASEPVYNADYIIIILIQDESETVSLVSGIKIYKKYRIMWSPVLITNTHGYTYIGYIGTNYIL